jgi:hypothetical protein
MLKGCDAVGEDPAQLTVEIGQSDPQHRLK